MFGTPIVSHNIRVAISSAPLRAVVTSVETYVFEKGVSTGPVLQRPGWDSEDVTFTHVSLRIDTTEGVSTLYSSTKPRLAVLGDIVAGATATFTVTYEAALDAAAPVFRLSDAVMPDAAPPLDRGSAEKEGGSLFTWLAKGYTALVQGGASAPTPPCETCVVIRYDTGVTGVEPLIEDALSASWSRQPGLVTATWKGSDVARNRCFGARLLLLDCPLFSSLGSTPKSTPAHAIYVLVDCSASMKGPRMAAAKEAVRAFVHSLPRTTAVDVYRFGSSYSALFGTPTAVTPDVLLGSIDPFVQSLDADLGGTDLVQVLKAVFESRPACPRKTVVVLTDSDAAHVSAVASLCRLHSASSAVLAVGVQNVAGLPLLRALTANNPTVVSHLDKLPAELLRVTQHLLVDSRQQ